jgi:hypothetical protein
MPRLETAEPDEPSRVTQVDQLAVSVHIPIAEYLSMGDMPGKILIPFNLSRPVAYP